MPNHNIIFSMFSIIPIISIAVTALSIEFGLYTYNLRNLLRRDPNFWELFKYLVIEEFYGYSIFLVQSRLLAYFLKFSFIYNGVFYAGIVLYLLLSVVLPRIIDRIFKRIKFQFKFEFHMLIFLPNFISNCYKKCNVLSDFHFYRKLQLVHGIAMAIIAITLFRTRTYIFSRLTVQCTTSTQLKMLYNSEYAVLTLLGVNILMFIIEIVRIIYCGKSFLDWAYKEVCSEKSNAIQTSQTYAAYNYYYYYYFYYVGDCSKDTKINKADWRRNTI